MFVHETKDLLSTYGLNWSENEINILLEIPFLYASEFLNESEKEVFEILKLWNFLRVVEDGDIELEGVAKNSIGGWKKGWNIKETICIRKHIMNDDFLKKVDYACNWVNIADKFDFVTIQSCIDEFNKNHIQSESREEKDGKEKCARELWANIDSCMEVKRWTKTKKLCLVHDLMSLHGIIPKRDLFGVFKKKYLSNELRTLNRWIEKDIDPISDGRLIIGVGVLDDGLLKDVL